MTLLLVDGPMKIRYRWTSDPDGVPPPMHGDYLMSERGRGGYLILAVNNRGQRGGLGAPVHTLLVLTVDRVSRAEAIANIDRLYSIKWDSRARRGRHLGADGRTRTGENRD